MALRRRIYPFEQMFVPSNIFCQLAMVVESKADAATLVDRLRERIIGLRLRLDGYDFVQIPKPATKVHRLPDNFPDLEKACIWTWQHTSPNTSACLASLCANDDTVILNVHHQVSDGGYFKTILDHIFDDKLAGADAVFPIASEAIFADELARRETGGPIVFADPALTHVFPNRVSPRSDNPPAHYVSFACPPASLTCYNETTKKCHGLTDHLWASEILAATAFNGKILTVGAGTNIDLRQFFAKPVTWANCSNFAVVTATLPSLSRDETYGQLCARLRASFAENVAKRKFIDYMKGIPAWITRTGVGPPGVGIEITNIGAIKLKRPFRDAWIQQATDENTVKGVFSLQSASCLPPDGGPVDVVQRLRYAPSEVNEREAMLIAKFIKFGMQNFEAKTRVGEALDALAVLKNSLT
jgi:hypothetical protein